MDRVLSSVDLPIRLPPSHQGLRRRWSALCWITTAEVLAVSVWLSPPVVGQALMQHWHLPPAMVTWLTDSVQLGFVAGALCSATIGLADRFRPRPLMTWGSLGASCTTLALLWVGGGWLPFLLRALSGACLAIVYPVAVQWVANWFPRQRGLAVGAIIGGLTIGSALPHLLLGLPLVGNWRAVLAASAALGAVAAILVRWVVPELPGPFHPPPFRWDRVGSVLRHRPVMLASIGYWGHMWELYAMWAFVPAFMLASWAAFWTGGALVGIVGAASFVAIGVAGLGGALAGGWAADRWGRTAVTTLALATSATMALVIGLTYSQVPWLTFAVAAVWGLSVIADSAQYSVAVTELCPPALQGSALTLQMAVGFLITLLSINLMARLEPLLGWSHVLSLLAIGPVIGIAAMLRLRRRPEASALADGRR